MFCWSQVRYRPLYVICDLLLEIVCHAISSCSNSACGVLFFVGAVIKVLYIGCIVITLICSHAVSGMLSKLLPLDIIAVVLVLSASSLSANAAYWLAFCSEGLEIGALVVIICLCWLILLVATPNHQAWHSPGLTRRYFLCMPFLLHWCPVTRYLCTCWQVYVAWCCCFGEGQVMLFGTRVCPFCACSTYSNCCSNFTHYEAVTALLRIA